MKNLKLLVFILILTSCNNAEQERLKQEEEQKLEQIRLDNLNRIKELKTISQVTVGDNINLYEGFEPNDDNIYLKKVIINEIEGDLRLYLNEGIIYSIEFISREMWLGSTSVAYQIFRQQESIYTDWLEGAVKFYKIKLEYGNVDKNSYTENNINHEFEIKPIELFGIRAGTALIYRITDLSINVNTTNTY